MRPGDPIIITLRGIPGYPGGQQNIEGILDENGSINLPFLNFIEAAGKTASELEREILTRYVSEGYYRTLGVNIIIPTQSYFVRGEVRGPGRFPLTGGVTILQALAAAGGYTEFANKKSRGSAARRSANPDQHAGNREVSRSGQGPRSGRCHHCAPKRFLISRKFRMSLSASTAGGEQRSPSPAARSVYEWSALALLLAGPLLGPVLFGAVRMWSIGPLLMMAFVGMALFLGRPLWRPDLRLLSIPPGGLLALGFFILFRRGDPFFLRALRGPPRVAEGRRLRGRLLGLDRARGPARDGGGS